MTIDECLLYAAPVQVFLLSTPDGFIPFLETAPAPNALGYSYVQTSTKLQQLGVEYNPGDWFSVDFTGGAITRAEKLFDMPEGFRFGYVSWLDRPDVIVTVANRTLKEIVYSPRSISGPGIFGYYDWHEFARGDPVLISDHHNRAITLPTETEVSGMWRGVTGSVKMYNRDKRFGFIRQTRVPELPLEIHFHLADFNAHCMPEESLNVRFNVMRKLYEGKDGYTAFNIQINHQQ